MFINNSTFRLIHCVLGKPICLVISQSSAITLFFYPMNPKCSIGFDSFNYLYSVCQKEVIKTFECSSALNILSRKNSLRLLLFKVSRYSNGHKYPKQKQRTPNLTSFAQIGLAIMFTTNSCVKHRILHVLRDADAISHVKTGEINADVVFADVIKKCNF